MNLEIEVDTTRDLSIFEKWTEEGDWQHLLSLPYRMAVWQTPERVLMRTLIPHDTAVEGMLPALAEMADGWLVVFEAQLEAQLPPEVRADIMDAVRGALVVSWYDKIDPDTQPMTVH